MDESERIEMRKIVPVAAMVSAGKSKFLNTIYNINYLECKAGIGTKFINILRYNPKIKEPHFFHLKIKKEGEKYLFYKDILYQEVVGEKEIIEENKNINNILSSEKIIKYENIFYMTEINESPFIKDEEYLLKHDLCDIPGLSEYQEGTPEPIEINKNDIGEEAPKPIGEEEQINVIRKELDLIKPSKEEKIKEVDIKEEDEIYYMTEIEKNTYISEIFKIIKNYIDGIIIILSVENYYFEANFELIVRLHKVIEKSIRNCLIILNKIDKSQNPEADIRKCKSLFLKYFPSCKTFNINLNTFAPLSTIQFQNEILSNKSFKHLLNYHLYNYMDKINKEKLLGETVIGNSFYEHLINIVKTEEGITRKDIEKKVDNSKDKINEKEIINIIKELREFSERNKINFGIKEDDFKKIKKKVNLLDIKIGKPDSKGKNNDNIDEINPSYIIKLLYLYQQEKKLLPQLSEETLKIINYFKIPKQPKKDNQQKKEVVQNEEVILNKRIINSIEEVITKMKDSEFQGEEIKKVIDNMYSTIDYLKIYNVIFIPFLGPSNAGKSTILNNIIGQEVLPTELNECTKRGIIIRYSEDYQKEINIRKAIFKESIFMGKAKYYFEADDIITQGLNNVKDTLRGLNYEFTDKQEDSFYYIRTKIKLFDDLGLDNHMKKLIYLIDFPGYGTKNKFEQFIYNKVTSICNSFMFIIRNSLIKETHNQIALKNIFNQALQQKNELSSGFVKSCLFILNNDDSQETTEKELNNAKDDLAFVIKKIKKEDLNACFFNAKYYSNYIDNYNYFNNIDETINNELKMYNKYKSDLMKNPEKYKDRVYTQFIDYLYGRIVEKIKEGGFGTTIDPEEEIDEYVQSKLVETLNDLESNGLISKDDVESDFTEIIAQLISFAKRNLSKLGSLKESNIEILGKNILNHINSVNSSIQDELKNNLSKEIKLLDYFFNQSFSDRIKDLKFYENFIKDIKNITNKIAELSNKSKIAINSLQKNYGKKVKNALMKKEKDIKNILKTKNWKSVREEIGKEMIKELQSLNKEIDILFNDIDYNTNIYFQTAKNIFLEFTEHKIDLTEHYISFKIFFMGKTLKCTNGNILEEIFKELKGCIDDSMSKILSKKGLFSFFTSAFSNLTFFTNLIDIIMDLLFKETQYIFDQLNKYFGDYIRELLILISNNSNSVSFLYHNQQTEAWDSLCSIYKNKREMIYQDLNKLIKK